ncbi:MAG TPA: SPASM domain-containing protein [bacterium]|nr:SPASM domain-containing protein [bacterium]
MVQRRRAIDKLIAAKPAMPPLSKLYVEPTAHCNLTCRTCIRNSWTEPPGEMDMAVFANLLDGMRRASTLHTVAFWGFGEPLLHPRIAEMVAAVRQLGLNTEMITNGLLLDEARATALTEAGLDTLVVSVDGAQGAMLGEIRPGADLGAIDRNVMRLMSLPRRPKLGLEFVAMRRNLAELPHLPELARRWGAEFIIVSNLLPPTAEMKNEILYWLASQSLSPSTRHGANPEIRLAAIDTRPDQAEPIRAVAPDVSGRPWPPSMDNGLAGSCPFVEEGAATIGWDGAVGPCIALMHSHTCYVLDRKKSIRRYAVGNIAERDLSDIWNDPGFVAFRRRVLDFEFSPCVSCGGCEMAEANEEDCFGNPFPTCGDCLWAKGVLLCP